ncbi:TetR/AcrR family transcriptional regulator [Mycobacterium sp. SMC-11]|uniref:TetR/AcrR family transcriptional regulator n=1 Tax=Mycobacterium sp. SMC-11 TaxID=3385969 RepID=UPI00390CAB01
MTRGDGQHRLGPFRDPNVDSEVLSSTRRLLIERGYRDTSVDAIAEAAGVSRPTIYRRWPSKAHVVYDAAFPADATRVEPSGDAVIELKTLIHNIVSWLGDPAAAAALPGLIVDMRSDPALQASIGERHSAVFSADLRELFARNGEVLRPVDPDTVLDMIVGAAMQALSIRNVTDLDAYAQSLTEALLHGVLARDSERPA